MHSLARCIRVAQCRVPTPSVLASGMRHTQGLGSDVDGPGQRSLYGLLRAALMARVYALQDRMMDFVLKHCLICAHSPQPHARVDSTDGRPLLPADNVAWEDPRIDQHLLRMGAEDTLLVLTTGGCNVLDPPCFISQGESVAREIAHA